MSSISSLIVQKSLRQALGEFPSFVVEEISSPSTWRNVSRPLYWEKFLRQVAKYCSNCAYDMISDIITPYSSRIGFQVENLGRRGNPKSQHRLDERACRCATSSTLGSMDVRRFSLRKFKLKPKYVTSHKCNIFVIELKYLTYNLCDSLDTQRGDPIFKHYGWQGLVR